MNSENERLKEMLNEATNNYNGLQMHLQTLIMQERQKGVAEGGKNGLPMHRQFVDLGIPAASNAKDVVSSSDDGRMAPNEIGEGNDQNKFPNHSNNAVDQATEATIRKARVSVRARCEGPMVYDLMLYLVFHFTENERSNLVFDW